MDALPEILSAKFRQHFLERLTLNELAVLTGRSLSAFKAECVRSLGLSPFRWIIQRRIRYANELLQNTNYNISEIAFYSGFENLSHFSRCYKAVHKVSPSVARSLRLQGKTI